MILLRKIALSVGTTLLLLGLVEAGLRVAASVVSETRGAHTSGDRRRILCVGDSNTFGVRVAAEDSYPGRLEAFLNRSGDRYQVLNRGRPGQNTALILKTLRDDLERDRPEVLLVLAGINNGWNVAGREQESFLDGLRLVRLLRIAAHDLRTGGREEPASGAGEAAAVTRATDPRTAAELRQVTRDDLVRIAEVARGAGVRCVLQTYPSHHPHMPPYNDAARDAAAASGALLSDHDRRFGPYIERYGWDRLFFEDSHPVEAGYALMARDLLRDLLEDGVVDGTPLPDDWEPAGFRESVTLEVETGPDGRPVALLLGAAPGEGFQVYLSPTREPEVDLGTRRIPIGQHAWVEFCKTHAPFRGETGADGTARVPLPEQVRELPSGAILYAAFVTRDPRATHALAVRSISDVVEIHGAGGAGKRGD